MGFGEQENRPGIVADLAHEIKASFRSLEVAGFELLLSALDSRDPNLVERAPGD